MITKWPQRIIDALGGRAPRPGDVMMPCCVLDVFVVDAVFIADELESYAIDGFGNGDMWWPSIESCIESVRADPENHGVREGESIDEVIAKLRERLRLQEVSVDLDHCPECGSLGGDCDLCGHYEDSQSRIDADAEPRSAAADPWRELAMLTNDDMSQAIKAAMHCCIGGMASFGCSDCEDLRRRLYGPRMYE